MNGARGAPAHQATPITSGSPAPRARTRLLARRAGVRPASAKPAATVDHRKLRQARVAASAEADAAGAPPLGAPARSALVAVSAAALPINSAPEDRGRGAGGRVLAVLGLQAQPEPLPRRARHDAARLGGAVAHDPGARLASAPQTCMLTRLAPPAPRRHSSARASSCTTAGARCRRASMPATLRSPRRCSRTRHRLPATSSVTMLAEAPTERRRMATERTDSVACFYVA